MDSSIIRVLEKVKVPVRDTPLTEVADRIRKAKSKENAIILMMGRHVIRSGVQRYIIDMMEKGSLSCIAMNGAGTIHDFEFALIEAMSLLEKLISEKLI